MTTQSDQSCAKLNTSRNNWKALFEVNISQNSTKTIKLFTLDFYEVIVDSAFGLSFVVPLLCLICFVWLYFDVLSCNFRIRFASILRKVSNVVLLNETKMVDINHSIKHSFDLIRKSVEQF